MEEAKQGQTAETKIEDELRYELLDGPFGRVLLLAGAQGLRRIHFQAGPAPLDIAPGWTRDPAALAEAAAQLEAYFAGEREAFDLPLDPRGTPFQREVWAELRRIPYGQTRSYAQLAAALGRPEASRAVGAANGGNPLAVVIPCHRVLGADGALRGYAGGTAIKAGLLQLEAGGRQPRLI